MADNILSDREQAAFEAGIKLGTLYHQFVGAPVRPETAGDVERAMAQSISVQPFVESIDVRLRRDMIESALNGTFGYTEVQGKMIDARLSVRYGKALVSASLELDEKTDYPLMKILSIREDG